MWRDAYFETPVLSADPLELIHILYEHTIAMVGDARRHLAERNIEARGRSITRAIAAIDELNQSLDYQAGGAIARNLAALYHYMRLRLLTANVRQEDAPLAEVEKLLRTVGEAWDAIRPAGQVEEYAAVQPSGAFETLTAEMQLEYAGQGWNA